MPECTVRRSELDNSVLLRTTSRRGNVSTEDLFTEIHN